jgi:hypothetical protein
MAKEKDDPCWKGYRQIGMKKKNGRKVPNCVPESYMSFSQFVEALELHEVIEEDFEPTGDELYEDWGGELAEAEHKGRKVSLGKPFLTPGGPKKRAVYVKNDKGNVVKVNFGDPNMTIKKNIPARRKSFRARHGCDVNPGPRHKAKYWSCKQW